MKRKHLEETQKENQSDIITRRLQRAETLNEQLRSRLKRPKELSLKQIENGIKPIDFNMLYSELFLLYQSFVSRDIMRDYLRASSYQLTFSKYKGKSLSQIPISFLKWSITKNGKQARNDRPFIETFLNGLPDKRQ